MEGAEDVVERLRVDEALRLGLVPLEVIGLDAELDRDAAAVGLTKREDPLDIARQILLEHGVVRIGIDDFGKVVAESDLGEPLGDGSLDILGEIPRSVAAEIPVQMVVDHDSKKITDGTRLGNGAAAGLRGPAGLRRGAPLIPWGFSEASGRARNEGRRR
jgi:hypothetical protein